MPDFRATPPDRRYSRMREILAQRGDQGATIRQLQGWLSAEGLNVPREPLYRWLVQDQAAGLVTRRGEAGLRGIIVWYWDPRDGRPDREEP